MGYLPLDFIRELETSMGTMLGYPLDWRNAYKSQKDFLKLMYNMYIDEHPMFKGWEVRDEDFPSDMDTYLKYARSLLLIKDGDTNPLADKFRLYVPELLKMTGRTMTDVKNDPRADVRTDLRSLISEICTHSRWVQNKQVLKPDDVFAYHLAQTEKLKISKEILNHLPYTSFYVDLSDCTKGNLFGEVKGVFVDVLKISDVEYSVFTSILVDEKLHIAHYLTLNLQDTNEIEINTDVFVKTEECKVLSAVDDSMDSFTCNSRNIKTLVLQLLCYMSVSAPDIEPNPQMKHTYRPNQTIKNKFREVFVNDVGIKVGAKITKAEQSVVKAYEETDEYKATIAKNRKPPKPHFRRAHWHRYWTGKGRTELKVNWVEPVFVCGNISSDVIVHKVE